MHMQMSCSICACYFEMLYVLYYALWSIIKQSNFEVSTQRFNALAILNYLHRSRFNACQRVSCKSDIICNDWSAAEVTNLQLTVGGHRKWLLQIKSQGLKYAFPYDNWQITLENNRRLISPIIYHYVFIKFEWIQSNKNCRRKRIWK